MTHINFQQSLDAFVAFIAAANQQKTKADVLGAIHREKIQQINQDMETLTQLALAGMEGQIAPLLNTLLEEWSIKEAVEVILKYQPRVIDPLNQGLQQSFSDKLRRKHQSLSSELLLQLEQGKQAQARDWHTVAKQGVDDLRLQNEQAFQRDRQWVQDQQQLNQQFHNAALGWVSGQQQMNQQWFTHEQQMFSEYQQANQQWAATALNGVQQAQLGMKQWYDFATATQSNVAAMLAHTQEGQGLAVQEALQKVESKSSDPNS